MNDTQSLIGTLLLDDKIERDAIHVAVLPVRTACRLDVGQDIGFVWENGLLSGDLVCGEGPNITLLGIVDPYLHRERKPTERYVKDGDRFFMFLYPNTITDMRHHWTHPAVARPAVDSLEHSQRWLQRYAARVNSYDAPNKAYERFVEGLKSGKYFAHGSDCHGVYDVDDADELRHHVEKVLGIRIDWNAFTFSCSCL